MISLVEALLSLKLIKQEKSLQFIITSIPVVGYQNYQKTSC